MVQEFSVDAACSCNPGPVEYRMINNHTKEILFHKQLPDGTNNIGEFLALVEGITYCQERNLNEIILYSDSVTAMAWVRKKFANSKYKIEGKDNNIIQLLSEAENWLNDNEINIVIKKWDTRNLGEIPADFGRK